MGYKVTSPLVVIKNAETGADWYGYDGATVPVGLNDERCKQLVKEGMLEKTKDAKSDKSDDSTEGTGSAPKADKPANIGDILKEVGDDKEKAQAALEAENATEKPRPSLVTKLQAVLDAEPAPAE